MLIVPRHKGAQFGLKGQCVLIPADLKKIQTSLPRTCNDNCSYRYQDQYTWKDGWIDGGHKSGPGVALQLKCQALPDGGYKYMNKHVTSTGQTPTSNLEVELA